MKNNYLYLVVAYALLVDALLSKKAAADAGKRFPESLGPSDGVLEGVPSFLPANHLDTNNNTRQDDNLVILSGDRTSSLDPSLRRNFNDQNRRDGQRHTVVTPTPGDGQRLRLMQDENGRKEELDNDGRGPKEERVVLGRELQTANAWSILGSRVVGEAQGDESGFSVSLSGDGSVLAAGARFNDGINGTDSGHVRVYKYNATNGWTQLGSDIDGEAANDRFGSSVSLSHDGSVVAVGAVWNNGRRGHARVFKYNSTSNIWNQLGADIEGEAANDELNSVSLSSNGLVLAVGIQHTDGPSNTITSAGSVEVYQYAPASNSWIQLGTDIEGNTPSGRLGFAVSLSSDGTVVAAGAPYSAISGINQAGYVRVYKYNTVSNQWVQLGLDMNGINAGDLFGYSVSLSGDGSVLAAGTFYGDGDFTDSGIVRTFKYTVAGVWTPIGGTISGEAANDVFGRSVSLSNDGSLLAVGANGNDSNGATDSGHARVYAYNQISDKWTQLGNDIDGERSNDKFGVSVSLSNDGSLLAVGEFGYDGSGGRTDSGAVRVFQYVPPSPPPTFQPTPKPTALPTLQPTTLQPTSHPTFPPSTVRPTTASPSSTPTNFPTPKPTALPTLQPTTLQPTSHPTFQPSSVSPTTSSTPTYTPTPKPTALPTLQPTSLPLQLLPPQAPGEGVLDSSLPFLGRCPAQVDEEGHYYYEPGDRVSNDAIVFECTNWPNSLFCSQVAFTPHLNSKSSAAWKQAWKVVGRCTDSIPSSELMPGCPGVWASGDKDKYNENDLVSVIKSYSPIVQATYRCKAWPLSWYCGSINPLSYNGGKLGWEFVGECSGTIKPTMSPTPPPGSVIIPGCPPDYEIAANDHNYKAGDQVSRTKIVYRCREFPYSGYCNQKGFAPGEQYDYMAWTIVGPCDGSPSPTGAPISYADGASCTYVKASKETPTPTPVVTPVRTWSASTLYEPGDQVRIGAKTFQCKPWPYYFWCRVSAYAPTLHTSGLWTEAWSLAGSCP